MELDIDLLCPPNGYLMGNHSRKATICKRERYIWKNICFSRVVVKTYVFLIKVYILYMEKRENFMERDIYEIFESYFDDYLEFEEIENKRSNRPDLHAFLLLEELFPTDKKCDMISCASHDEFWLDISFEQIEKLTDDQILELVRCGVRFDDDSLCMLA